MPSSNSYPAIQNKNDPTRLNRRSGAAHKSSLPPCLINHNGCGIGKIQTSIIWPHWNAQPAIVTKLGVKFGRQTARLRAKHEYVTRLKRHLGITAPPMGRQGKHSLTSKARPAVRPISMHGYDR